MTGLSFAERLKIRSLALEQTRRRAVTMTLSSPLLRWRYSAAASDQILIVPQELRSADPSFWYEVEQGCFGLASEIADLKGASPFRIRPPSLAWERELNGFGWLRHLAAAESPAAAAAARELVRDWIAVNRMPRGTAFEPAVMARRLMSWISQANLLLDDADVATYSAIMTSIGEQVVTLKTTWRNAPDGQPRLTALIALVLSDLAVAGHDRQLSEAQGALVHELRRQILPDGGHASRNASVLADIVLDLLPLSQCFLSRGRKAPPEIGLFIKQALAFLRFMRLGDGMLARFNGVSTGAPAALATVLGYCGDELDPVSSAPTSGYARLTGAATIVIADVGRPPRLEMATEAQAGALSFELTSGARQIVVNGGFPGPAHRSWDAAARATASHNTLCIAETSSSRLVHDARLEALVGGFPIRGPERVIFDIERDEAGVLLSAQHDGYAARFGLIHARSLRLSPDGLRLEGCDRIEHAAGQGGVPAPQPYAVHFHLHPDCRCTLHKQAGHADIETLDGERWRFEAPGAAALVEDSIYFVDSAGPRASFQLVLRGTTLGNSEVRWSLSRLPY